MSSKGLHRTRKQMISIVDEKADLSPFQTHGSRLSRCMKHARRLPCIICTLTHPEVKHDGDNDFADRDRLPFLGLLMHALRSYMIYDTSYTNQAAHKRHYNLHTTVASQKTSGEGGFIERQLRTFSAHRKLELSAYFRRRKIFI